MYSDLRLGVSDILVNSRTGAAAFPGIDRKLKATPPTRVRAGGVPTGERPSPGAPLPSRLRYCSWAVTRNTSVVPVAVTVPAGAGNGIDPFSVPTSAIWFPPKRLTAIASPVWVTGSP
jgi:hypothetical protein